ncbi:MAG: aminotransferase class V-fold PLP-dependent enzyme [Alphaproteobacteria bacterium]|nr:aminotransferase class V-fold PLP-dependent enzyme [Alphaproteobacteria bacterium]
MAQNMDKKEVYIDSAATALKSESVIATQAEFLRIDYANASRGTCGRAARTDTAIESVRRTVAEFIGAKPEQIVFTSGTTDGINRIAHIINAHFTKYGGKKSGQWTFGVSELEHHSARMPFEDFEMDGKAKISICPLDDNLNYDIEKLPMVDVLVITAMSNVFGVAQDVKKIIAAARTKNPNVITVVDAAQYVVHAPIDVMDWDCDFLCFSGHKIGSDTGVGVMYMKGSYWMPDRFGGGMVQSLSYVAEMGEKKSIIDWKFAAAPTKFEAGTLPLTQIVGLGVAIKETGNWKPETGNLLNYLRDELSRIERIKFISPPDANVLTFTVDGMHHLDFGAMMGARGICLRTGNMCASWLFSRLGIDGAVRISVGPWNTMAEMEMVVKVIKEVLK